VRRDGKVTFMEKDVYVFDKEQGVVSDRRELKGREFEFTVER
jgi:hypothetical protein